jgi:TetR/AcrR family transcriptional repressor of mexJK operon
MKKQVKPRRSRGRPRFEDVAAIENKLLAVALNDFLLHGYGGASMTRIVRDAGISKTTLYSRFSSKEELFAAIMNQQVEHLSAAASLRPATGALDLESGLRAYASHSLDTSLTGDFLGINRLIYSESHRFPELGAAAAERTATGIKQIARFIRDCAAADGIACKDAEAVAEVYILMLRGWYVNVMLTHRKVSAAQRGKWIERAVHALLSSRSDW